MKGAAGQEGIQAVLFDMDGVLVHSPLDLAGIKRELFGDASVFIIEGLEALPAEERRVKNEILLRRELEAAQQATLDPAVRPLFEWLDSRGLKRGVITRNSREVVRAIAERLEVEMGVVIGREDAPPKPDPGCVIAACRLLEVSPQRSVMVGDYIFDIEAGRRAGCRTVFIDTGAFAGLETGADVVIRSLSDLRNELEKWL